MPRFPSPGSLRVKFPGFIGNIKALRLPAALPAALRCLRLIVAQTHAGTGPTGRPGTGGKAILEGRDGHGARRETKAGAGPGGGESAARWHTLARPVRHQGAPVGGAEGRKTAAGKKGVRGDLDGQARGDLDGQPSMASGGGSPRPAPTPGRSACRHPRPEHREDLDGDHLDGQRGRRQPLRGTSWQGRRNSSGRVS